MYNMQNVDTTFICKYEILQLLMRVILGQFGDIKPCRFTIYNKQW